MFEKLTIRSGGQTGVDRAALDVALELGLSCTGWCPKGRKAEDGAIPERYPLKELTSTAYPDRTKQNVLDSDGTLVVMAGEMGRGTALTVDAAKEAGKPLLVLDLNVLTPESAGQSLVDWLRRHGIRDLNVAGPRESVTNGVYARSYDFLKTIFSLTP